MEVTRILAEIDAQIAKLQQARALLSGDAPSRRGPGRPKSSAAANVAAPKATGKKRAKRVLSAEARKRIADAQKKRWAAQRKQGK